jgi:hypothetical protein
MGSPLGFAPQLKRDPLGGACGGMLDDAATMTLAHAHATGLPIAWPADVDRTVTGRIVCELKDPPGL